MNTQCRLALLMALVSVQPAYAVTPSANLFVACSGGCDDVREFDGLTGSFVGVFGETGPVANLKGPTDLEFQRTSGDLFVLDQFHKDIRQFDGSTGVFRGIFGESAVIGRPYDLAIHPTTGNLFVMDLQVDVKEFDGVSGDYLGSFGQTGAILDKGVSLAFHPDSGNLFVLDNNQQRGVVREFDGSTGAFLGDFGDTASHLTVPRFLNFSPVTHNLFVTEGTTTDVREFESTTGAYRGVFGETDNLGVAIWRLTFDPNNGDLYVGQTSGGVYHYDGMTGDFQGVFGDTEPRANNPHGLTFRTTSPATVTFHTSESSFRSASAGSTLTTTKFEGIVQDESSQSYGFAGATIDGVTYSAQPGQFAQVVSVFGKDKPIAGSADRSSAILLANGSADLTIDFSAIHNGVTAAGGFFGDANGVNKPATVSLYAPDFSLLDRRTVTVGGFGTGDTPTFYGWTTSGDKTIGAIVFALEEDLWDAVDELTFGWSKKPTVIIQLSGKLLQAPVDTHRLNDARVQMIFEFALGEAPTSTGASNEQRSATYRPIRAEVIFKNRPGGAPDITTTFQQDCCLATTRNRFGKGLPDTVS